MATEILAIPKEYLAEVIKVIYFGLDYIDDISEELEDSLYDWCKEQENYLKEVTNNEKQ